MPVALRSNPTVDKAAQVWTAHFAAAVREAAGSSGRLTASKAAAMTGPYADNAQNYFDKTGKTSASVNTIIESAANYVRSRAAAVAGADGKLSLAEIRRLPADLVDDVLILRGKAPTGGSSGASGSLTALKDAIKETDISSINDYGKSFELTTYPASKSRVDILKEIIGYDDLTDKEVNDSFDSTRGSAAANGFQTLVKGIGQDQKDNADTAAEGDDLKKRFVGVADAAKAFFSPASKFKSLELAEHTISEDGDTEHRVLLAKQEDNSWLVLNYTDFPF